MSATKNKQKSQPHSTKVMPAVMSTLQNSKHLDNTEYIEDCITALKNLHLEYINIEAKLCEEFFELEAKYAANYQAILEKRKQIINGEIETTKEQPIWNTDFDDLSICGSTISSTRAYLQTFPYDIKGIPNFWLKIFKNVAAISDLIKPYDEPLINKLADIKVKYEDKHSFTLEFHFNKNKYFTNQILTKRYYIRFKPQKNATLNYMGPEIYKSKGCIINWKTKQNITIKYVKKLQRHKLLGEYRTIVDEVPRASFFNFFQTKVINKNIDKIDKDFWKILNADYQIGHFFRTRIIPKAILYLTGDIVEQDNFRFEDYEQCKTKVDNLKAASNLEHDNYTHTI